MMSHSIGRAGMTGEIPAAEKVETHDRDGQWNERGVLESGRQESGCRKGLGRAGMTSGRTLE